MPFGPPKRAFIGGRETPERGARQRNHRVVKQELNEAVGVGIESACTSRKGIRRLGIQEQKVTDKNGRIDDDRAT